MPWPDSALHKRNLPNNGCTTIEEMCYIVLTTSARARGFQFGYISYVPYPSSNYAKKSVYRIEITFQPKLTLSISAFP